MNYDLFDLDLDLGRRILDAEKELNDMKPYHVEGTEIYEGKRWVATCCSVLSAYLICIVINENYPGRG